MTINNPSIPHQYIDRETDTVTTEKLIADALINKLYSRAKENPSLLFKAATSKRMSSLLGFLNYDFHLNGHSRGNGNRLKALGIELDECLSDPAALDTPRKIFERKICYWRCRPMPEDVSRIVSPADARTIVGSLDRHDSLYLKEKFFSFEELLGKSKTGWLDAFAGGDFALFRLTPDKYHYNHVPVSGQVKEIYEIDGCCHSCNPGAVVSLVTPYSKNRRVVTVIDTDVCRWHVHRVGGHDRDRGHDDRRYRPVLQCP